ncbi:alkylhydroperoxidase, partial [Pseudomonas sp. GW531-E2]
MHADRLLPAQIAPEGYAALRAVEAYIHKSGLPRGLIELVKMRASQINGCAY